MRLSRRRTVIVSTVVLAALLGALTPLGFAPIGWFPIPILSLAGLFWLVRAAKPGEGFRLGWA